MRFSPESDIGANAGLGVARALLVGSSPPLQPSHEHPRICDAFVSVLSHKTRTPQRPYPQEPIKRAHPELTYADLWTLAGCVSGTSHHRISQTPTPRQQATREEKTALGGSLGQSVRHAV